MLIFWISHFLLSFIISYCFYRLLSSKFLSFIAAILSFGLFSGVWFIYPGSQELAPIISIFFLENTIIDSNGYLRLFRPFLISISLGLLFGFIFIFVKNRLSFRKRKD